jgi:serine/threonine protein phosphatase PrpC
MGMARDSSTADTALSIPVAARITTFPSPQVGVELTVKAFGITDKGKVRSTNEDQFITAELSNSMRHWQTSLPAQPRVQVADEQALLFLVADGMGGHRAGERASTLAVTAIEHFTLNSFKWFFGTDSIEAKKVLAQFQSALMQADAAIVEEAADKPELRGMGTTVTMAFQLGAQLCVVHVGDSRVYLYRERELHQLTKDHTLVAELVRSGVIQPDEAAGHRMRHVITNVVGGPEAGVKVEARALQIQPGDRVLLCSDGLTEGVTDEVIAATLDAEKDVEAAAKQLLAKAMAGPAKDNITLVVASFEASAP